MSRLAAFVILLVSLQAMADTDVLEKGRQVFLAANCQTCHTDGDNGGKPLSGGRELVSEFGTYYSPNITPDVATGIGSWTDEDFVRALRDGISPDGHYYYPSFPFTSYTKMRQADMLALKAYLFSQPAVKRKNLEHKLPFYMRIVPSAKIWSKRYFQPGEYQDDSSQSAQWNRGAYLVQAMGHCIECHTPRKALGVMIEDKLYAGVQDLGGEVVPNITSHKKTGIGRWSVDDIVYYFQSGLSLSGDTAGGKMAGIIDDSLSKLPESDQQAMAVYMKSLKPVENQINKKKKKQKKEDWE
jgi:mono/diheme cytochrome c family protein